MKKTIKVFNKYFIDKKTISFRNFDIKKLNKNNRFYLKFKDQILDLEEKKIIDSNDLIYYMKTNINLIKKGKFINENIIKKLSYIFYPNYQIFFIEKTNSKYDKIFLEFLINIIRDEEISIKKHENLTHKNVFNKNFVLMEKINKNILKLYLNKKYLIINKNQIFIFENNLILFDDREKIKKCIIDFKINNYIFINKKDLINLERIVNNYEKKDIYFSLIKNFIKNFNKKEYQNKVFNIQKSFYKKLIQKYFMQFIIDNYIKENIILKEKKIKNILKIFENLFYFKFKDEEINKLTQLIKKQYKKKLLFENNLNIIKKTY